MANYPTTTKAPTETLETLPLWQIVKEDIYYAWRRLLRFQENINIDKLEGRQTKDEDNFKVGLITLYGFVKTKVSYPNKKKYEEIKELDGFETNPKKLKYEDAVNYFNLITELLEELGITRIGKATYSSPSSVMFESIEDVVE